MDGEIIGGIITGAGVGAITRAVLGRIIGSVSAQIGSKLDYLFGKATGNAHNVTRSTDMLRQMQRIGIFDTPAGRAHLQTHFNSVLNNSGSIVGRQANGNIVRESLLMGPNGGVKLQSIWNGNNLVTFKVFGGGN